MSHSHVVSGLVTKRSEIDGQIISRLAEIKDLKQVLLHLDQTIKVFSPEFDLRTIKSKRTNTRNQYFAHGEAQRVVLGVLREHDAPMNSRQISEVIIERKGFEVSDISVVQIQRCVYSVLRRLQSKGVVELVDSQDGILNWRIAI